jgi:hypothetical protein
MRVIAFAVAVVSLVALTHGPAPAQSYSPGRYSDDPRSGPPRYYTEGPRQDGERPPYFTDRPPPRHPGEGFQPPPYRGTPPDRGERYERTGDDRPGARPGPDPRDREPPPVRRRVEQAPPRPPEADDRGNRGAQTTVWPPVRPTGGAPPRRASDRRAERPGPRGADRITVSVEEFRDLQDRVRELERLLAERHDFRDDRRGPDRPPIYR